MAKYEIPFSSLAAAAAAFKTLAALTAGTNATLFLREIHVVDELAGTLDGALDVTVKTGTSFSAAGTATATTPTPLGNAPASFFTAAANHTAEPTLVGGVTKLNKEPVTSGGGAAWTFYDPSAEIKVFGTGVIQVLFNGPAARSAPLKGKLVIEE